MYALILAGGRGKRLEPHTDDANKSMLRLQGKPLIQYSLESALKAGAEKIVVVVGYRAEDIINCFGNSFHGTPVRYVIQYERNGLVHAIECARDAMDGADFTLFLADEVLSHTRHDEMLREFYSQDLFAICGVVKANDRTHIRKTYGLLADEASRRIYRLIEKPRVPVNGVMGTGNCVLRGEIFEYIERTPLNVERGEKELPDLIQCAVDEGLLVKYFDIGDGYVNVNTPDDIHIAEQVYEAKLEWPRNRARSI